jgi:hypothetical protein
MSYIGKNVAPQPQGTYSQSEIDTQMLTKSPTDSPVFTGNLTVNTNTLFVDATNNRVGIGTSTPDTKVYVGLTGSSTPVVDVASFGANGIFSLGNIANNNEGVYLGTGYYASGVSAGLGFFRENVGWNSALAFYTNNVTNGPNGVNAIQEKMRLTSSGNVGIGTTNPTAKLDVNGTANFNGIVTMPNQPAFYAYGVTDDTRSGPSYMTFPNVLNNKGNHYNTSNGVFTCPVGGTYIFNWSNIGNNMDDVYRLYINVNNTHICGGLQLRIDTTAQGSEYVVNASKQVLITLSANDTVRIYFSSDNGNPLFPASNNGTVHFASFSGYLIG